MATKPKQYLIAPDERVVELPAADTEQPQQRQQRRSRPTPAASADSGYATTKEPDERGMT